MKKAFILLITFSLVLGLSYPVLAADKTKTDSLNTTQLKNSEIKTIFDYKDELGLSKNQIESIRTLVDKLKAIFDGNNKKLNNLRNELGAMLKNKEKLGQIKEQLIKISNIQIENSYADIETSRNIEGILFTEQLNKWKEMQQDFQQKQK
ncbi:MAG: hypothetical protein KJ722_05935 [Candidatus Omnitrophica bacterium]|nr:hypothetical protein [Candidatus Omnitrophota bacterium]